MAIEYCLSGTGSLSNSKLQYIALRPLQKDNFVLLAVLLFSTFLLLCRNVILAFRRIVILDLTFMFIFSVLIFSFWLKFSRLV